MKKPCKSCGSTEWTRLNLVFKGRVIETCDKCPQDNKKLSVMFKGLPTSRSGISQDRYQDAINTANRTGKTINL